MKIFECPRDAMQGMSQFIPTEDKIEYLNQLLKVGFDTIDFGSFVSPKAIPQMRDTREVVNQLDWRISQTKLLAIVANIRGANEAASFDAITYLGFPLSISETFQQRNTNKSIPKALLELKEIKRICIDSGKQLVTYISMGFGNPYGDPYNLPLLNQFIEQLIDLGSEIISLADTIGVSLPDQITTLVKSIVENYPSLSLGVHLHSTPENALEKIEAAYYGGCKHFDGALRGFGGCPMAKDELVGNLATETIIQYLENKGENAGINHQELKKALAITSRIFG